MYTSRRAVRAAATGLVLALLALALPALPARVARAAGLMTASPAEARIGDLITLNGTGFAAGQIVRVYLSANEASVGEDIGGRVTTYKHICDATTDARGAFTGPATFFIPGQLDEGSIGRTVETGDYYIYAIYQGSNRIQGTGKLFVLGPIVLTPATGKIGDWTLINASGLRPNDQVYIYFSSQKAATGGTIGGTVTVYAYVGIFPVSSSGTLGTGVPLQIPSRMVDGRFQEDVHGGDYYIYFTYYLSRTTISTVGRYIVLDGEISVEPTSATVGSEIKITGQGLRPDQTITVRFDGDLTKIPAGNTSTDTAGRFSATVLVPETTAGDHVISVTDISGNHPETAFKVNPKLTADPAAAALRQVIQLQGTGFSDRADITVTINDGPATTNPPIVTANHKGTFSCTFTAAGTPGAVTIAASDKLYNKAETQVTILPPGQSPAAIVLTPATSQAAPGFVGMKLTITGSHFRPNSPITVTYGGKPVPTATTGADGAFQTSFSIPSGPAGAYAVAASDGTNTASATFVLESRAPLPPVLTPGAVFTGPGKTLSGFDWQASPDESGVTYSLQVASDISFAGLLVNQQGLTATEYMLSAAEQARVEAQPGTYYWRVKAIDGAGNDSGWAAPVAFEVGAGRSGVPTWLWFAIGGAAVVLLAAAGLLVRQAMMRH